MPSTQQKISIGYFILAFLGLFLIQAMFFAPQSENLSYRDFKTLLKAGKVADLSLGEHTITGRLMTDGLEGLLPPARLKAFRKVGQGEYRFVTVQLDDPALIPDLEAAGVQFQGRIESHWLSTLLSWIVPALTFAAIWGLFMRRMSTASVLMTIGKSKAKVYVECEVHTPEGQTIVLEMSPAFLTRKVFQRCCSATRDEAYERQRHPNARVASWCSTSGTAPTVTARRVDDMARRGQANNGSGAGRA